MEEPTRASRQLARKQKQPVKIVVSVLYIVVISLLLLLVIENRSNGTSILGYRLLTVLSDSMTPTFSSGDVIISKKVDVRKLEKGDVITFKVSSAEQVTHRIVKVQTNGQNFLTKGDANEQLDLAPVTASQIVGKQVGKIKYLGRFLMAIKKPMGLIALGLTVLFTVILRLFMKVANE